jgi:hypothetical protein
MTHGTSMNRRHQTVRPPIATRNMLCSIVATFSRMPSSASVAPDTNGFMLQSPFSIPIPMHRNLSFWFLARLRINVLSFSSRLLLLLSTLPSWQGVLTLHVASTAPAKLSERHERFIHVTDQFPTRVPAELELGTRYFHCWTLITELRIAFMGSIFWYYWYGNCMSDIEVNQYFPYSPFSVRVHSLPARPYRSR